MPNRLTGLKIKRVALVDQGADQHADMVLFKRFTKEKDMTVKLDALPESLRKHFEGATSQELVDAVASALADKKNPEVTKLQGELKTSKAQVDELTKKLEEATKDDTPDDVTKGMSDEVKKAFEAERTAREEMQKRLDAEVEKNAIRDFTEIAKQYESIPGAAPVKLGPVLYRLNKNALTDEDRDFVSELLGAAAGVVKEKGLLLEELGRSSDGGTTDDPVMKIAKSLQAADSTLSLEKAYDQALQTPEGAKAYSEMQRNKAIID